ncbi:MAG: NADH-quinone oxidoreductase subunit A [Pyrodictiaceae archaeon]
MVSLAATVSLAVTFVLVVLGILLVVWIALLAIRGPEHPLKRLRYEAANPPRGYARAALPPQYYGYILIFLVVDTIFALIFLLTLANKLILAPMQTLLWILLLIGLLFPPLIYAVRYSRRIKDWA